MNDEIRNLLSYKHKKDMKFSEYLDKVFTEPQPHLKLSTDIILDAIKSYGWKITMRNGEPVISYNVFKDPFSRGLNAIHGQETCIKSIIDIIYSINKETGPNRGIVLVGPPASGKTNVCELITKAVEEYVKNGNIKLYTFCFKFDDTVYIKTSFNHNPLLLFPTTLKNESNVTNPRQELFDLLLEEHPDLHIPSFYKDATLDKKVMDIIEGLVANPAHRDKTLYDILDQYVIISEFEYSMVQGRGISNIDNMGLLKSEIKKTTLHRRDVEAVTKHLPDLDLYQYQGSLVSSNRGILHIHDAFDIANESALIQKYKPLLLLLGSGKINVESTQIPLDNITIMTTNLEEMDNLEKYLTSVKLLDRIEKIPVNYLIDVNAEIDLLKRDIQGYKKDYDIDPNFFKIAAYFSVMSRLCPPQKPRDEWVANKGIFYEKLTPDQKMFIYASKTNNIQKLLQELPYWHPFCTEARQLGIDLQKPKTYVDKIEQHPDAVDLKDCGLFKEKELGFIDEELKNHLRREHFPKEGNKGISTRQMQNILRDVILKSDNRKITVSLFLDQLKDIIEKSSYVNSWIEHTKKLASEEHQYFEIEKLIDILECLYWELLRKELTISIIDRDPSEIEKDLRKYLQHIMLHHAKGMKKFKKILIEKFSYIDPTTGSTVSEPNYKYMESIESVLYNKYTLARDEYRKNVAERILKGIDGKDIILKSEGNIIGSTDDNILSIFVKEHKKLLSNARTNDSLDTNKLKDAFYHKHNNKEAYDKCSSKIKSMCEKVINNMERNFGYSQDTALEAILYGFRNDIVQLSTIIKREDKDA
jgi:predicted Ser/Thr protein kinase